MLICRKNQENFSHPTSLAGRRVAREIGRIAEISKRLRKEREPSFYGDIDFIPTEEYRLEDAREALEGANFIVEIARQVIR